MTEKCKVGILIVVLLLFTSYSVHSQSNLQEKFVQSIIPFIDILGSEHDLKEKQEANDSIYNCLESFLQNPSSFHIDPQIPHVGKISASDGMLNIYTWNYQDELSSFHYGGLIQYLDKKKQVNTFRLVDNTNRIDEYTTLKNGDWYGCLYYSIITKKKRRKTIYTLLGWDGNDNIIARKFIDILSISQSGKITLGEAYFKMSKETKKRIIFQFSATGSMTLVYDHNLNKIIYDHLSPRTPELEGQFQYYGSDFSYDGLKYKRGNWFLETLLDPRNKE